MATNDWLILAIAVIGGGAVLGIFKTKTPGFGRYSTAVLLLALVLIMASLFLATGKIESSLFANVVFAVAGFAGGLITGKQNDA